MNSENLLYAIGNINDELIENATKPRFNYKALVSIAACLCIIIALPFFFAPQEPEAMGGAPSIAVNGTNYIISPYVAISDNIPEGFVFGGKEKIVNEKCEYYISSNNPYWVYVYQQVRTNGKTDSNGTLISTEPHYAYVRYVRADIRGKDLIMVNGSLYASVWSYNTDNSPSPRTETLPEGFEYYGETAFCGYDTIPEKELESNTGIAQVYVSLAEPNAVLVSTSWHTATGDENGETLHKGYNFYVPFSVG